MQIDKELKIVQKALSQYMLWKGKTMRTMNAVLTTPLARKHLPEQSSGFEVRDSSESRATRETSEARATRDSSETRETRKTRYTRQVIRDTFIELLKKQPLEKVTVTRICEEADISRGTFYLHYHDPYHLMECMEDEYLAGLELRFAEKMAALDDDYSESKGFWLEILEELLEARELAVLFFTNPNSTFLTKCLAMNRKYADEMCRHKYPDMSDREREYNHVFYEHGSASVIDRWVKDGFLESPAMLADLLSYLNSKR